MALASVWSYNLLHWAKEFTGLRLGCTGLITGNQAATLAVFSLASLPCLSNKRTCMCFSWVEFELPTILLLVSPAFQPVKGAHPPTYQKLQNLLPFHLLQPARQAERGPEPSRAPKGTWPLLPPSHAWGLSYLVWPVQPGHGGCLPVEVVVAWPAWLQEQWAPSLTPHRLLPRPAASLPSHLAQASGGTGLATGPSRASLKAKNKIHSAAFSPGGSGLMPFLGWAYGFTLVPGRQNRHHSVLLLILPSRFWAKQNSFSPKTGVPSMWLKLLTHHGGSPPE